MGLIVGLSSYFIVHQSYELNGILNCNGTNACGDPILLAAVCSKAPCPSSPDSFNHVIESPFASWAYIIEEGYWCMPCCVLGDQVNQKMKICSDLPGQNDICEQASNHGRCGIEFNP